MRMISLEEDESIIRLVYPKPETLPPLVEQKLTQYVDRHSEWLIQSVYQTGGRCSRQRYYRAKLINSGGETCRIWYDWSAKRWRKG